MTEKINWPWNTCKKKHENQALFDENVFSLVELYNCLDDMYIIPLKLNWLYETLPKTIGTFRSACFYDNILIIKWFLKIFWFTSSQRKKHFLTHGLYDACAGGHVDLVQYLIKLGANVGWRRDFNECIKSAFESGNEDLVDLIIAANQKSRVKKHRCHMWWEIVFVPACKGGNVNLIERVLQHYNPDSETMCSGFETACGSGRKEAIYYLIATLRIPNLDGGFKNLVLTNQHSIISSILTDYNKKNNSIFLRLEIEKNKEILLLAACIHGNEFLFDWLLKNYQFTTNEGLYNALPCACIGGNRKIIQKITDQDKTNWANFFMKTSFGITCSKGDIKLMREVIDMGGVVDKDWEECFEVACRCGYLHVIKLVLCHKPYPTNLSHLYQNSSNQVVKLFLSRYIEKQQQQQIQSFFSLLINPVKKYNLRSQTQTRVYF